MVLKFYGEYPNVPEAIKHYQSIFDVQVVKNGVNQSLTSSQTHGNIKIFKDVTLLLNIQAKSRAKTGNLILSFDGNNDAKTYLETVERLKNNSEIDLEYINHVGKWGTTLTKFKDKYGYTWTLEINSKDLNK